MREVGEKPWYNVLWAPWRMAYIKKAAAKEDEECIFCKAPKMDEEEALVVYKSRLAYIIMNKYPYNTGHIMIVPYRHVGDYAGLTEDEIKELGLLLKASINGLRRALNPHGFNIGINLGRVAGAGIAGHVHIHVVPRWDGDTNFMLVTGRTKVIPQDIKETYKTIKGPITEEAKKLGLGSGAKDGTHNNSNS